VAHKFDVDRSEFTVVHNLATRRRQISIQTMLHKSEYSKWISEYISYRWLRLGVSLCSRCYLLCFKSLI